ncbi:hypothetical protein HanXRQr2_Chr10g0458171 [Helianthus annuus]|uniref:Uncharacterized protein n=1 Tax=Helianthus annuus TaxID=4232 RepID=A0A9K3N5R9_HELAN|nr:hypothetical protein HanXRQr2_Chr10g0458171 [Helianthus annuus]
MNLEGVFQYRVGWVGDEDDDGDEDDTGCGGFSDLLFRWKNGKPIFLIGDEDDDGDDTCF